MPEPMSEEHSFDHIPDEFINWKGDTAAIPNTLVGRVTEVVSYAQAMHIELDRLRSLLADRDAQVTRLCGELATAQSPPSAKEAQDALDELVKLVVHDDECMADNGTPELCDGTCRASLAEDQLDALIARLATGNAQRLSAAETVCEAWRLSAEHDHGGRQRELVEAAMAEWEALRGGGDDAKQTT